jgi:hypothetical protein
MVSEDLTPESNPDFPPLPLANWEPTKETLHLYLQIIGKIKLTLMPRRNHWWNITLYVTSRGLGTGPIPYKLITFEIDFDFITHQLLIKKSSGETRSFPIQDGLSVSAFYASVMQALNTLDIHVAIKAEPFHLKSKIPFADDHTHKTYNSGQVTKYWHALETIDQVMKEFSGCFYGKSSPVQLFWHHMDLAVTRYSGKSLPVRESASVVEKDSSTHEFISFGFWPGDENIQYPAFYAYAYPSPDGIDLEQLAPKQAHWIDSNGSSMALLNYEELRQLKKPREKLMDFLESAYKAGAELAKWPVTELKVIPLNEL